MAPFGPAPEMVSETRGRLRMPVAAAESSPALDRGDLVERALRRLRRARQEAGQRRAVAAMGRARAGELDRVLAAPWAAAQGSAAASALGAGRRQRVEDPRRRRRPDRAARGVRRPERGERRAEAPSGARERPRVAEMRRDGRRLTLRRIDEERRPAVRRQDARRPAARRVRHVAAADVEQPGDRMRGGQHRRVGALSARLGARCARACPAALSPAKRSVDAAPPAPCGGGGRSRPGRIERIGRRRPRLAAGLRAAAAQALDAVGACAATGS